jgi:hypothetical protein
MLPYFLIKWIKSQFDTESDMMIKLNSLSDTNPKAVWDLVNELKYENKSDKGTNLDAPHGKIISKN